MLQRFVFQGGYLPSFLVQRNHSMERRLIGTEIIWWVLVWCFVVWPIDTLGSVYVPLQSILLGIALFYLPWYWWSFLFFESQEVTVFERWLLAISISVPLIWFLVWYLSYFGAPMNVLSVINISVVVVLLAGCIELIQGKTWNNEE